GGLIYNCDPLSFPFWEEATALAIAASGVSARIRASIQTQFTASQYSSVKIFIHPLRLAVIPPLVADDNRALQLFGLDHERLLLLLRILGVMDLRFDSFERLFGGRRNHLRGVPSALPLIPSIFVVVDCVELHYQNLKRATPYLIWSQIDANHAKS